MNRKLYWLSCVVNFVLIAVSVYGALRIPPDMPLPVHWNIRGEADWYLPRNTVLVLMPALAIIMSLIYAAIPMIEPRKENAKRSSGLYYASWFGMLCLTLTLHSALVFSAARGQAPSPLIVFASASTLIIVIGNYMTKSRSNWFFGLRTPWSLSSERAWIAANRATGWLFVITGILSGLVASLLDVKSGFTILAAGVIASALIGVAVSYQNWREDREQLQ
ncbi:MAG: SdpI family protein [Hyphomonadaceae bacterium]